MRWTHALARGHASREIDLLENLDIVHITLLVDIYLLIEVSSPPARALQRYSKGMLYKGYPTVSRYRCRAGKAPLKMI